MSPLEVYGSAYLYFVESRKKRCGDLFQRDNIKLSKFRAQVHRQPFGDSQHLLMMIRTLTISQGLTNTFLNKTLTLFLFLRSDQHSSYLLASIFFIHSATIPSNFPYSPIHHHSHIFASKVSVPFPFPFPFPWAELMMLIIIIALSIQCVSYLKRIDRFSPTRNTQLS